MQKYQRIKEQIEQADAILVSASNGFSIAEGLHIFADDAAFQSLFGVFKARYGIHSILQGLFFNWPAEEARWAFYARLLNHYSGAYTGSAVMKALIQIIGEKPYFIVTSNGENHFELAGLNAQNIFEIEGSWKEMRCADGCCATRYPTWPSIKQIAQEETNGYIPTALLPRCPHCGGSMQLNFQPDLVQQQAYQNFVARYHNQKILVLELGVGAHNQLIKAPLIQLVAQEPQAHYITFNKGEVFIPEAIREKSIGVDGNLSEQLPEIAAMLS